MRITPPKQVRDHPVRGGASWSLAWLYEIAASVMRTLPMRFCLLFVCRNLFLTILYIRACARVNYMCSLERVRLRVYVCVGVCDLVCFLFAFLLFCSSNADLLSWNTIVGRHHKVLPRSPPLLCGFSFFDLFPVMIALFHLCSICLIYAPACRIFVSMFIVLVNFNCVLLFRRVSRRCCWWSWSFHVCYKAYKTLHTFVTFNKNTRARLW
jgi:hypothetical protein